MPSKSSPADERAALRGVLRPARDAFRSALARTIEEVRTFLDAREGHEHDPVAEVQASLGAFAAGRVDPARFSALRAQTLSLDASDAQRIRGAFEALKDLHGRLDALLEVRVPTGGSLRDSVALRLAEIGRAFGAAHVVTAVRGGSFDEALHGPMLAGYPFERWSRAERALAPALVVDVAGADCRAASLAEFLDGACKLVLRIGAPCAPAPLARLLAPRTHVQQAAGAGDVAALAGWSGAGIAALVPEGSARFCYAPTAGALDVQHVPTERARPLGWASAAQQEEELELLGSWGASVAAPGDKAPEVADPAGQLATWLLRQARLDGAN